MLLVTRPRSEILSEMKQDEYPKFIAIFHFDGQNVTYQEAREKQYSATEMHTLYFRHATGEILNIIRRKAGEY